MKYFFSFLLFCNIYSILDAQQRKQSFIPIVFVHGFLGSGDTYATQFQRFELNGYKPNQLYVFDWNSIGARGNVNAKLDSFVQVILKKTGARQINLVGHSAGGGIGYSYLNDSLRATRVAHYVHIGSGKANAPAGKKGEVPTLNIFSPDDKVAKAGNIPGATNREQPGNDHYEVATSEESFKGMFEFFNDREPAIIKNIVTGLCKISGKACVLGENTPLANIDIDIFPIDLEKGQRKKDAPVASFKTDANGNWGPFMVQANTGYEFVLKPGGTQRNVYYYREAFTADDQLVYLRALPTTGMTALLLKMLPTKDEQTVAAIFTSNKAVVYGRDTLAVDGMAISSATVTPASKTAIAQFLFDDGDGQTSGKTIGAFNTLPFMNGIDQFIPANTAEPLSIYFNGRTIRLPRRKSDSEGIMVVVLN